MNIQFLINNMQNKRQLEGFLAGFIARGGILYNCNNEDLEVAIDEIMVNDSFMDKEITFSDLNLEIVHLALSIKKERRKEEARMSNGGATIIGPKAEASI